MKIKFSYLSSELPYTGKTGVVYNKFNALVDMGYGARLCVIEPATAELAAKVAKYPASKEVSGEFDIKPSYGRKEAVLVLVGCE